MGKHATDVDKAVFLTYLLYVHQAEAARRAGLAKSTATDIKNAAADVQIRCAEQGLPPPTIQEQVEQIKRKEGSGAKPKITDDEVIELMEACTLNKSQRRKLWHIVAEWEKFPQERIRALVTRMAAINNLIIEFEGGNEFHG
jgi:hypothetical protein